MVEGIDAGGMFNAQLPPVRRCYAVEQSAFWGGPSGSQTACHAVWMFQVTTYITSDLAVGTLPSLDGGTVPVEHDRVRRDTVGEGDGEADSLSGSLSRCRSRDDVSHAIGMPKRGSRQPHPPPPRLRLPPPEVVSPWLSRWRARSPGSKSA